jgi:hypothetical protein
MNTLEHIADQVARTYNGAAWHGDSITRILDGVDAPKAFHKPFQTIHSIWEIALHIIAWEQVVLKSLQGATYTMLHGEDDWPLVKEPNQEAWQATLKDLEETTAMLKKAMVSFPETKLHEQVPGQNFTFYIALEGITQHNLYHMGQIAILKKM